MSEESPRGKRFKNMFSDIQLREANKIRRDFGLPLIAIKVRQCLRCDKDFDSFGRAHRICHQCNSYLPSQVDFGVKVNAKN